MNDDGTDVIRVGLERGDFLGGVVVVDANLKVIGTTDYPVLAGYKATSSYRDIGKLERFDDCLGGLALVLSNSRISSYLCFV